MSAHIGRMEKLIEAMKWEAEGGGRVRDITAGEVYANTASSIQIFERLYAEKDRFDHSQVTLLRGLKERAKAYCAAGLKAKTTPLNAVVLGGGPVGMRTAVEMALMGHKVTVMEMRDTPARTSHVPGVSAPVA